MGQETRGEEQRAWEKVHLRSYSRNFSSPINSVKQLWGIFVLKMAQKRCLSPLSFIGPWRSLSSSREIVFLIQKVDNRVFSTNGKIGTTDSGS